MELRSFRSPSMTLFGTALKVADLDEPSGQRRQAARRILCHCLNGDFGCRRNGRTEHGVSMDCNFIPEVVHTHAGKTNSAQFCVRHMCGTQTGMFRNAYPRLKNRSARCRGRNVFFFVSGGVDSTVAYTLCLRALGRNVCMASMWIPV